MAEQQRDASTSLALQALVQAIPGPVFVVGLDDRILASNRAAVTRIGPSALGPWLGVGASPGPGTDPRCGLGSGSSGDPSRWDSSVGNPGERSPLATHASVAGTLIWSLAVA